MTEQNPYLNISDVALESVQLAIRLCQIAREHPDATCEEPISSDCSHRWKLSELADHLSAISNVLCIIAETPNGYINQEALGGLRDECNTAVRFLMTPWAVKILQDINSRWP